MKPLNRTTKLVGTAAAAVGLLLGAAGVASAVSGPTEVSAQPAISQTAPDNDTIDTNEANDANETPEQEAAEDAAEQELLNSFSVSPDQASQAALAVVPGTVDEVEIDNDGASPVFEVEIIDANGQEVEVTVDPNTGDVIDHVVEGPDDEANEGPEANEANEAPEATEVPGGSADG